MSKDRLLSDEELEEAVSVALMGYGVRDDALLKRMHKESMSLAEARRYLKNIINTQKKLYAESVENNAKIEAIDNILIMGSDYEATGNKMDYRAALVSYKSDLLRAEQRARIK